jgi:dTDP-4-amino-4,6-dideoxygalactose transaminase
VTASSWTRQEVSSTRTAPVDTIPLVDLAAQHEVVAADVAVGFQRLLSSSSFILGPEVAAFEDAFAEFTGVQHCVGVASGTDALELMLRAVGVGAGDEVLVPTNSFFASALAVSRAGATPVFVDVDADTYLVSADAVEERIGPWTAAIMAVHLYGQMAPVQQLRGIAGRHGIVVVEDAAQAHGALQVGEPPGRLSVAGTSFYPGKNLGCYGDGGAVLTDSVQIADRVRRLRNYGAHEKYRHAELGSNSRLDALQAVVLHAKLRHLAEWNEARRAAAARYCELLADMEHVRVPRVVRGNTHVWHLFVIRVPNRDRVLRHLWSAGIEAGIHYPVPIHLQPAYAHLGYQVGDLPAAEEAAGRILSLPLYPHITVAQQERIVDELRKVLT